MNEAEHKFSFTPIENGLARKGNGSSEARARQGARDPYSSPINALTHSRNYSPTTTHLSLAHPPPVDGWYGRCAHQLEGSNEQTTTNNAV